MCRPDPVIFVLEHVHLLLTRERGSVILDSLAGGVLAVVSYVIVVQAFYLVIPEGLMLILL
jgi:hypothetical protein